MQIKPAHKKPVFLGALGVFGATYVPLMVKFYRVFTDKEVKTDECRCGFSRSGI